MKTSEYVGPDEIDGYEQTMGMSVVTKARNHFITYRLCEYWIGSMPQKGFSCAIKKNKTLERNEEEIFILDGGTKINL